MKRSIFALLTGLIVVASVTFMSCNNVADNSATTEDSTMVVTQDSTITVPVDTLETVLPK